MKWQLLRLSTLDSVRLALSCTVLWAHTFLIVGAGDPPFPAGAIAVALFFALSGFLLTGSWQRSPCPWRFVIARAARLLPGLWFCLLGCVILAACFWPNGTDQWRGSSWWHFIYWNWWGDVGQVSIGQAFEGNPHRGVNNSLWSLRYEIRCYGLLMLLGLCGFLSMRGRWSLPLLAACLLLEGISSSGTISGLYDRPDTCLFAAAFVIGASLWCFGIRPPADGRSTAPDLSYGMYLWGFPVQQVLAFYGVHALGVPLFFACSVLSVLPVASVSWYLIERPGLVHGRALGEWIVKTYATEK
jgi:peptidoglycan/LPS O-acetylase OafA/YrhL